MTDKRTVLDVLACDEPHTTSARRCLADRLGEWADMPFEQFARWLRYGERADTVRGADGFDGHIEWVRGWNDCLSCIEGDD